MEYRLCNNTYFSLLFFVLRGYLSRRRRAVLRSGSSGSVSCARGVSPRRLVRKTGECSKSVLYVRSWATIRPERFARSFPDRASAFRRAFFRLAGEFCRRIGFCRGIPGFLCIDTRRRDVGSFTKQNPSCACARGILFCERTDVPSPRIDTKKTGNAPAKSDPPAEFPCQAKERASESGGPVRKAPRETFGTDRGPRPNVQHAF